MGQKTSKKQPVYAKWSMFFDLSETWFSERCQQYQRTWQFGHFLYTMFAPQQLWETPEGKGDINIYQYPLALTIALGANGTIYADTDTHTHTADHKQTQHKQGREHQRQHQQTNKTDDEDGDRQHQRRTAQPTTGTRGRGGEQCCVYGTIQRIRQWVRKGLDRRANGSAGLGFLCIRFLSRAASHIQLQRVATCNLNGANGNETQV